MDSAAAEGIKVRRKGCDEGLSFSGPHLDDLTFVEDHTADKLNVEVALTEGTLGGLPDGRETLRDEVFQVLTTSEALAELAGLGAQLFVR